MKDYNSKWAYKIGKVVWNQYDGLQPKQIKNALMGASLEPDVQRQKGEW